MLNLLFQARNGVFGIIIILALAVLGLSAHWTQLTINVGFFDAFEGIGLGAGSLAVIVLSTFLIVGLVRKNAIITVIGVELPTLVILSGLFLAEGIITNTLGQENWPFGCDDVFPRDSLETQNCKQFMALKSISFAIFGILTAYWFPLLIMVIIALTQGQNTFGQSVRDVTFSRQTQVQAQLFTDGFMGEIGLKDPSGESGYDQHPQQLQQQQQIQLQQLQLQQLQQQQAMLQQQQYMQQEKPQV